MLKFLNDFKKRKVFKQNQKITSEINQKEEFCIEQEYSTLINLVRNKDIDSDMALIAASIREIVKRKINIRLFDVQLIGSLILYSSNIAEMRTGEGKTYVSIIPAILQSLKGNKVHIVTANQYLANRDYKLLAPIFADLNISCGVINESMDKVARKENYNRDIIFTTSKELVFDYMRDNMVKNINDRVQSSLDYALIDEIDYILIDEARKPMIISSNLEEDNSMYLKFQNIQSYFIEDAHFIINKEKEIIEVTEEGYDLLESKLIELDIIQEDQKLYSLSNLNYLHYLDKALKANHLFQKDVRYIIRDGEALIIDENSGRIQVGSRWSEGMHQAIEAKENIEIKKDSQTLSTMTLQNYFKLYKSISGMTGTAETEEEEFSEIYDLLVIPVPTNKPIQRIDEDDLLFQDKFTMYQYLSKEILEKIRSGRPVLVGTPNVSESAIVSELLNKNGIPHNILNAKNNELEATIIENAGKKGVVTISTNMAGRGTDIMLGGNKEHEISRMSQEGILYEEALSIWQKNHDEVIANGGLHVIGIERNESRRIDNQLIGRAGRQGDAGSSNVLVTLEDKLFKNFIDKNSAFWTMINFGENGLRNKLISNTIRKGQKKLETINFNARKNLLKYDYFNSLQREVFYEYRNKILESNSLEFLIDKYFRIVFDNLVLELNSELLTQKEFVSKITSYFHYNMSEKEVGQLDKVYDTILSNYKEKINILDKETKNNIEKNLLLNIVDQLWAEHVNGLEVLRKNNSFKGYASKDPTYEYNKEAKDMFEKLLEKIKFEYVSILNEFSPIDLITQREEEKRIEEKRSSRNLDFLIPNIANAGF